MRKLCRICGRRLQSTRHIESNTSPVECCKFRKEIYTSFNVSTWGDSSDVHPQHVCSKCARSLRYVFSPTGSSDGRSSECIVDISWEKHPRVGPCKVCSVILKRGRPAKIKKTKCNNLTTTTTSSSTTNDDSIGLPIENNGSLFEIPPLIGTSYGPVTPLVDIIGKSTNEQTIFVCCVCQCIPSSSRCRHHVSTIFVLLVCLLGSSSKSPVKFHVLCVVKWST